MRIEGMIYTILFIALFCGGIYVGDLMNRNQNKMLMQEMEKTRQVISDHLNAVVLIDSAVASAVGFEPRAYDIDAMVLCSE